MRLIDTLFYDLSKTLTASLILNNIKLTLFKRYKIIVIERVLPEAAVALLNISVPQGSLIGPVLFWISINDSQQISLLKTLLLQLLQRRRRRHNGKLKEYIMQFVSSQIAYCWMLKKIEKSFSLLKPLDLLRFLKVHFDSEHF